MRPVPYFLDAFPRSRRPDYPRHRGDIRTRRRHRRRRTDRMRLCGVLRGRGIDVVLVEADRIGAGATAASAGLLRQDFDASFQESASLHGLRTARHVWQGFRRAALDFGAALRRLGSARISAPRISCISRETAPTRRGGCSVSTRREGRWRRRVVAQRACRGGRNRARGGGAIRTKGDVLDPYRACVGLAAAAAAGARNLHERTAREAHPGRAEGCRGRHRRGFDLGRSGDRGDRRPAGRPARAAAAL